MDGIINKGLLTYNKAVKNHGINYLKKYGPVGCRDYWTKTLLDKYGIPCYFSGCLTLTLGRKYQKMFADDILTNGEFITHEFSSETELPNDEKRFEYAGELIKTVRRKGRELSHNVPAVYNVLAARIEKRVAFLGLAKCGEAKQSCYIQLCRISITFYCLP
jgi:hypothetical protein